MIDFIGQAAVITGAGRGPGRPYALDLSRLCAVCERRGIGSFN